MFSVKLLETPTGKTCTYISLTDWIHFKCNKVQLSVADLVWYRMWISAFIQSLYSCLVKSCQFI